MRRLPAVAAARPPRLPDHVDEVLPSGLRVLAVRRRGEPLVEMRLRIPFAGVGLARAWLLASALTAGTARHPDGAFAAAVTRLGGTLTADVDPDRLLITGRALEADLGRLLGLLADLLDGAAYPPAGVESARGGLLSELLVAGARPSRVADAELARRIHPGHPYGERAPAPADLGAVARDDLPRAHARRVRPGGATLVLVGGQDPAAAAATAARRLGGWTGAAPERPLPPVPPLDPGALLLADLPGAAQSSLRIALPAVPRGHPDSAALRLANLVFGGYFSSRWVANLRDDRGYSYSPRSAVEDRVAGSRIVAAAEAVTAVTAPALAETLYELGRLACLPPTRAEVERARRYTVGSLAVLGMATHRALADLVEGLAGGGLPLTYLTAYLERLAEVSVADVHEASRTYLAPAGAVVVVVGDAGRLARPLGALLPVVVQPRIVER